MFTQRFLERKLPITLSILLLIIFINPTSLPNSLDSLNAKIADNDHSLYNVKNEYQSEQEKHPIFAIYGEIKDREGDALQIWGTAIPSNDDFSLPGTVTQDGNIIVFSPHKNCIQYTGYFGGQHYYLFKDYKKNVFNADVPVRYYGDLPSDAKTKLEELKQKIQFLQSQKIELSKEWEGLKYANLINEAREYLRGNNYKEAIRSSKDAKSYAADYTEIDSLLSSAYEGLVNHYASQKDNDNALSVIKEAILSQNLTLESLDRLKEFYFNFTNEKAEENYNLKKYQEAIGYYSECLKFNKANINRIKGKYAQSFQQLGDENIKDGKIEDAKKEYIKAIEIDNSTTFQIITKLSSFQRQAFLYGVASFLPGLGQMIQGYSENAFTHFAIFSGSLIGGLILNNVSKNEYNDYKNASTEGDAVRLYGVANKKLNISYVLYGLSGAIIIYSIIDSFIKAENFNKNYEINLDTSSKSGFGENYNLSLTLKLYF
jgi:tetratricopeptide (TPR) repeat protein